MMRPLSVAVPDSSSSLLIALSRFFRRRGLPLAGLPGALRPLFPHLNRLPARVRQWGYAWSAWVAGMPPDRMGRVSGERIAEWATRSYDRARSYPAIAIGSSNGALIQLCAMLGIPWLPQTFLTVVRQRGRSPDDPLEAVEQSIAPAGRLLEANPDLALYQIHDPVNDRPVLEVAAYFRHKRLVLGPAYESFILEALEPGGTVILVECERRWPTTGIGPRHFFQFGGAGGVTLDEYFHGGERVERFLSAHGSPRRRWEPPQPDAERPESEWGFDPALREDVERFTRRNGYQLVRLSFEEPEHLSPVVADFHRAWYRDQGQPASRLVGDSFFLMDPWWSKKTGSVPWWSLFNTEPSVRCLAEYLETAEPYDEIWLMLLSNMVDAIGSAPPEQWERLTRQARVAGGLLGVTPHEFPNDLATIGRYHPALQRLCPHYPVPQPVPLSQFERFLANHEQYRVSWRNCSPAG